MNENVDIKFNAHDEYME